MAGPRYSTTYKQLMETGAPGLRVSYATYNSAKLQTQRAAFLIKEFLCNHLAGSAYDDGVGLTNPWTMHWSCDGTTGPTIDGDNTDRITDHTKFATRADSASSAISYYVLKSGTRLRAEWVASTAYEVGAVITSGGNLYVCQTAGYSDNTSGPTATTQGSYITDGTVEWRYIGDGDGYLYLCVAFRTAQDYFLSISISTKFARAATPTYFPIATANSAICLPGSTHQRWLAGSDASGDRLLHITARDDGTGFFVGVLRAADIPSNGGCVVLGRIPDEYLDGADGSACLTLPAFLWNANATSLKSNSINNTTVFAYNTSNTIGGALLHSRSTTATNSLQGAVQDALLLVPQGYSTVAPTNVVPLYTTDGISNRRKGSLGWKFQSWPITHISTSSVIMGTVQDMTIGTPLSITPGQLFGLRWWCYGMLLFPNPSLLEPAHT